MHAKVRTRFAPSPTGFMHVGNLRSALYEYLVAKVHGGEFILRVEDTDQKRQVEGALDVIYDTLKQVGIQWDEGPDIGGDYGPYIQSERRDAYGILAHELVEKKEAYYCFCTEERLQSLRESATGEHAAFSGYDRHCRHLSDAEVQAKLDSGIPYVIRQMMPLEGETTFTDAVYGDITVQNEEMEDQILLKSDGLPTYNFANVVDDHAMRITHVVRGSEYLSSTPKYNLLYKALGYEIPTYVHLPLILGEDGQKLSKRHGATGFRDLIEEGYLAEAVINYISLLGWAPKDNREIFSLKDLEQVFSIEGISKSPSVFDYKKLRWFNAEYIKAMSEDEIVELLNPWFDQYGAGVDFDRKHMALLLQPRLEVLTEMPEKLEMFRHFPEDFDLSMFAHKKMKTTEAIALDMLNQTIPGLEALDDWTVDSIHAYLIGLAQQLEVKNGQVMWPIRVAASGLQVTPGGAVDVLYLLGRTTALDRAKRSRDRLAAQTDLES